jgi:hypothetical protein
MEGNSTLAAQVATRLVLSVASTTIGPVLRARRLSWSNAVTSTGPGAKALRASSKSRDGNVNNTADGLIRIRTAIGCASDACTKFPGSIWQMPMRPSLGCDRGIVELRLRGVDRRVIGVY